MSQCCGIKQYTDREVTANRPHIIIKNNKEKTCTLVDVGIPADRNVVQNGSGKEVKIEEFMYSLRKNLEAVPGKHSIDSLQKTAILGTSHIIRKVLQSREACSVSGGDHCWFKRSTGKKWLVTGDSHI